MLDSKTRKKITDFVYVKPRTIQEIAHLIQKNWRTADSYVDKIIEETGILGTRVFREGTRGALKMVFWNNIEKIHSSELQERLYKQIEAGRKKTDFSPFDIYQYVDEKKRNAFLEQQSEEAFNAKQDLSGAFRQAKKQIMLFSGNLSWANLKQNNEKLLDVFRELAKNKVPIKILANIDITGLANAEKFLAINDELGRDAVEIRHCLQPLRCFIVDDKFVRFKEIKNPEDYVSGKKKKTFIFYEIYDREWIEWLQKVFWNLFRTAIPAEKRIADLKSIEKSELI
jgi:hypothetical protein